MTVYDSSVLIDYLDSVPAAEQYAQSNVDRRAVAPPLVLFEVFQGEVFKRGPADFDGVVASLGWVSFIDETPEFARTAAELQAELQQQGTTLSAGDVYIAGVARALDETLAVADADFAEITDFVDVDFVA
jgi:predicted nucleic acid-binding protein